MLRPRILLFLLLNKQKEKAGVLKPLPLGKQDLATKVSLLPDLIAHVVECIEHILERQWDSVVSPECALPWLT